MVFAPGVKSLTYTCAPTSSPDEPALRQWIAMSKPTPLGREPPADPPPDFAEEPLDSPVEVKCPKCDGRLIDPEEMGYCPACGYCRYVEEARRNPGFERPKPPTPTQLFAEGVRGTVADVRKRLESYRGSLSLLRRLVPERNEVPKPEPMTSQNTSGEAMTPITRVRWR